ncbi:DUF2310 family Zn-ribbon-containing protein [Algoriphagus winogradskyi]|uniref:Zn-ribbon-containing, possibly nucleic-acid-binding protein n=1 Tax=Algoriphagus winogradskyi TaxID=237017 RepID=A0ABY1PA09_9BACT|nr:DUF2310 family Zn-ribbon-containing protein [Algoriphagus winogradskyi]SMP28484.1 Zn-ribbon-containing, possibly nucleic-acid-binding protein [Algoriphagus winogradskyi]
MTDKPFPAKILLTLVDSKSTGEEFIGLSATLYRQNLIFPKPRELRREKNILELIVIFRDNYSFKNWNKNIEVKEFWYTKFVKLLSEKPKTLKERDVIIEVDNVTNCGCDKSDFYILKGRSLQFIDELTCSNCFGQISYSRIPLEIQLEDWQTKHERIYSSWLESGLFEKEAYKELTNYKKGKLNLEGEKIRKQLSDYFKLPVYISYFVEEPDDNHTCLVCGQKGFDSGLKRPNKICKTCNTIFDYGDK